MKLFLLKAWETDNTIQSLLLLTTIVSIYFLYRTLKEGQRQSMESNELTKQNLSISQYQIYIEEFKHFTALFRGLKFKVSDATFNEAGYKNDMLESDGIDYMPAIRYIISPAYYFYQEDKKTEFTERINEYRHHFLFPLFRQYSQLLNFLARVKDDALLKPEHKKLIYLLTERDLLQNYFRLCNNQFFETMTYDLELFATPAFQVETLHAVNRFYAENNLFALHTHKFYKETL